MLCLGFPGGGVMKNPPANAGDADSIPGMGRGPEEGNGNPLQYSCLGNTMDESLAGGSPWGHEELDMTERLHIHTLPRYVLTRVSEHPSVGRSLKFG